MESKKEVMHTPEPWSYEAGKGYHEGTIVITSYTMSASSPLAHISNICDDAEPDARRIVACVNACTGVGTEALEKQGGNAIHAMAQRDELLAALKDLIDRALSDTGAEPSVSMLHRSIDEARAAIAKCEVQS